MFDPTNIEIITEFLASDACNQDFTVEMLLGAEAAVICCPREIENEVFCDLVVGALHKDWLNKTPLRLARMQINDAISEAFLAKKFKLTRQFEEQTAQVLETKLAQWGRGFMIASLTLNSLWQQDFGLLSDILSQKEIEQIQDLRSESFALADKIASREADSASKQQAIVDLSDKLQKLHDAAIYLESVKIKYKIS